MLPPDWVEEMDTEKEDSSRDMQFEIRVHAVYFDTYLTIDARSFCSQDS